MWQNASSLRWDRFAWRQSTSLYQPDRVAAGSFKLNALRFVSRDDRRHLTNTLFISHRRFVRQISDQGQLPNKIKTYIYICARPNNVLKSVVQSHATSFLCPVRRFGKTQDFRRKWRKLNRPAFYTRGQLEGENRLQQLTWLSLIKMTRLFTLLFWNRLYHCDAP